jgi:DNA-binding IclR family transcriptional regulator
MARQYLVPAITRALDVIEMLSRQDTGMSISEIHRALRLPLSSAANIVYTLKTLGYLDRDEVDSRYRVSLKMLSISRRLLDRMNGLSRCHDLLEELVRESGLTAHLAVMRDGQSIYIDRVAGDGLVQVSSYVGMRWPAHSSAVGKALLAFLPAAELDSTLKELPLHKVTPRTVTSRRVLATQFESFRRTGYAWEMEEGEMGVACVAAPVFGPTGDVVAAASVTGTTRQIPRARLTSAGTIVKKYAQLMSQRLGAVPGSNHAHFR